MEENLGLEPQNYFLTVNRYETRKKLELSIDAFKQAIENSQRLKQSKFKLVIAGGYDKKNSDAIVCRSSLLSQASELGIADRVVFRENISQEEKEYLLR